MPGLRIRPLLSFDELAAGVELQKKTWGRQFDDIVSAALMRVAQKIGGIAAGAFDSDDTLVAIVFGLSGIRDDDRVHWSHMLAVEPGWRGRGLGTVLKIYQRRRVLSLGVDRMFWTFDPLEARNAHFNINRLGVRIESYVDDMYGSGETSTLHQGIGTDRFIAFWPLRDPAVKRRTEKIEEMMRWGPNGTEATTDITADTKLPILTSGTREDAAEHAATGPASPETLQDVAESGAALVEIPPEIQRLKAHQPEEAAFWRTTTRKAFVHYFSEGMTVTGFFRDPESGRCFYVMDRTTPAMDYATPATDRTTPATDHSTPPETDQAKPATDQATRAINRASRA